MNLNTLYRFNCLSEMQLRKSILHIQNWNNDRIFENSKCSEKTTYLVFIRTKDYYKNHVPIKKIYTRRGFGDEKLDEFLVCVVFIS